VLPRIRGYFNPARRTQRALLLSRLAKDVISIAVLQKGLSPAQAAVSSDVIDLMLERLIGEGVKANSEVARAKARALAGRALAGAAAEYSGPLAEELA
jgi:hypothetical protein